MKVFDLECAVQHVFEGWFATEADYADQRARQLIQCPVCGDAQIAKRLSAPRLQVSRSAAPRADPKRAAASAPTPSTDVALAVPPGDATQTLLRLARAMLEQTQDVGERFADEARSIHYGESQARPIRGQATPAQTRELLEEGIPVLPFLLPESLKGPLQ